MALGAQKCRVAVHHVLLTLGKIPPISARRAEIVELLTKRHARLFAGTVAASVDTTTKYVHSNREQTRAVLNARPGIPVTIPVTDLELADLNHVADVLTVGNHNASEDGGIGRRAGFRFQCP